MQILESSSLGLRSDRLSLGSPSSPVRVTLFPMVHVGEPAFYRRVYEDALSHDVVLFEGVKSPITRRVTRSYRWIEGSRKLALVVQPKLPLVSEGARIIHADLSREEFETLWRTIPLWLRLLTFVVPPIIGLRHRWGSRQTLAKGMSKDDLPSREEIIDWNPETSPLTQVVLHARDDRLIERLGEQLDHPAPGVETLAVVYGAAHMRRVLRELTTRRGYFTDRTEWMTIFPLERPVRSGRAGSS